MLKTRAKVEKEGSSRLRHMIMPRTFLSKANCRSDVPLPRKKLGCALSSLVALRLAQQQPPQTRQRGRALRAWQEIGAAVSMHRAYLRRCMIWQNSS